jgi:hypothetical protein
VDGDYITDDFTIGGATVKSLEMGFAASTNITQGLLAVGYPLNEASEADDPPFQYPNIIDSMVSQGLLNTKAYSLFLDDLDASSGSIIFGGLDSDKFHGDLVQMPIIPTTLRNGSEIFVEFGVAVTSLSVGNQSLTSGSSLPGTSATAFDAILDSGTSITLLPTRIARSIFTILGAVIDDESIESSGFALVDCDLVAQNPGATFDFGFGSSDGSSGVTISVPFSEMIISQEKLGLNLVDLPRQITFQNVCILGLLDVNEEPFILGDTFLRSAYVVYDLQNNQIALAQTNFNSTSSNVVEFTANESTLPHVSGVASGVSVSATATGPVGGKPTVSTAATGSSSSSKSASNPGSITSSSSAGTSSSSTQIPSSSTGTSSSGSVAPTSGSLAPTSGSVAPSSGSVTPSSVSEPPSSGSGSSITSSSTAAASSSANANVASVASIEWSVIVMMCSSAALAILGGSLLYT